MSARVPPSPPDGGAGSRIPWLAAVVGPGLLTLALLGLGHPQQRDYVFLYLGLVAVLAVFGGLWPTMLAAGVSFLRVDYFFVSEVILGHRRSPWTPWDTTSALIRGLAGVDVHVLRSQPASGSSTLSR